MVVEGFDIAPQTCLIDSGATAVRLDRALADVFGISLDDAPQMQLGVGGEVVTGALADVSLSISDGNDTHGWTAPVWFCEPWRPALGLTGFFDQFEVTIASYEERIELVPISD